MTTTTEPDILTVSDVAALLRISRQHVGRIIRGQCGPVLPALRMGRLVRIRRDALDRWLVECERGRA